MTPQEHTKMVALLEEHGALLAEMLREPDREKRMKIDEALEDIEDQVDLLSGGVCHGLR